MEDDGRASSSREPPIMATVMADSKLQLPASCDPPGPQNPPEQLVWVIFGASGHIGRSVAKAALSHNDMVTAVGRIGEDTIPSIQSSFQSFPQQHCLPLLCDVRVRSTVDAVMQQSITHFGRVDIIAVCTAGYGIIGACEDQDDYDIRNQFETNFFGTVNILHASLPYFRTRHHSPPPPPPPAAVKQEEEEEEEDDDDESPEEPPEESTGGGRYLIFSSTTGALGAPGLGPYCATARAVEGLVESMLYETHAFNIKATL
ncbi:MAG: hypothetical protein Q9197_005806, partial [Variospora fuerteventurae]